MSSMQRGGRGSEIMKTGMGRSLQNRNKRLRFISCTNRQRHVQITRFHRGSNGIDLRRKSPNFLMQGKIPQ
jgi:hypothetical protein